jgi:hypothetical protein
MALAEDRAQALDLAGLNWKAAWSWLRSMRFKALGFRTDGPHARGICQADVDFSSRVLVSGEGRV